MKKWAAALWRKWVLIGNISATSSVAQRQVRYEILLSKWLVYAIKTFSFLEHKTFTQKELFLFLSIVIPHHASVQKRIVSSRGEQILRIMYLLFRNIAKISLTADN